MPPGVAGNAMRMVPDVASLAGSPGYWLFGPGSGATPKWEWQPITGDSMTGPLHAAALASVRSALLDAHVDPPKLLTPVLYELASEPATYAGVFQDVVHGDNMLFNDACCTAGTGYDLTTGLGQLDFAQLVLVLAERGRPPAVTGVVPAFTG